MLQSQTYSKHKPSVHENGTFFSQPVNERENQSFHQLMRLVFMYIAQKDTRNTLSSQDQENALTHIQQNCFFLVIFSDSFEHTICDQVKTYVFALMHFSNDKHI